MTYFLNVLTYKFNLKINVILGFLKKMQKILLFQRCVPRKSKKIILLQIIIEYQTKMDFTVSHEFRRREIIENIFLVHRYSGHRPIFMWSCTTVCVKLKCISVFRKYICIVKRPSIRTKKQLFYVSKLLNPGQFQSFFLDLVTFRYE